MRNALGLGKRCRWDTRPWFLFFEQSFEFCQNPSILAWHVGGSIKNFGRKAGISSTILALVILALLIGGAGIAYLYRNALSQYAIIRYLDSRGISIDFTVVSLNPQKVVLKDIVIEDAIVIDELSADLHLGNIGLGKLRSLRMTVSRLDIPTAQKVMERLSSPEQQPKAWDFFALRESCAQLYPLTLDVRIQRLTWGRLEIPSDITLTHASAQGRFDLSLEGKTQNIQAFEDLSLAEADYAAAFSLICAEQQIEIATQTFSMNLAGLKYGADRVDQLKMSSAAGQILITTNNVIAGHLTMSAQTRGRYAAQTFDLSVREFSVKASSLLQDLKNGSLKSGFKSLKIRSPQNVSMDSGKLSLYKQSDSPNTTGDFQLDKIKYRDDKAVLAQNMDVLGTLNLDKDFLRTRLDVRDATNTLHFEKLEISQNVKTSALRLKFGDLSQVKLSPRMEQLWPSLKDTVTEASGTVALSGQLDYKSGVGEGRITLKGKNINAVSEYGTFKNLNFEHDVISLPPVMSSENRTADIEEVVIGAPLEKLKVNYQMLSPQDVRVENLSLLFDGATITSSPFTVDPLAPAVKGFKAKIVKFPLESLLKMGLKDTVTASGQLSGNVTFSLVNRIPQIEGTLAAEGPGWIRHRTGKAPTEGIKLSDGPMEILNGYLYDFSYQTLSVDIKTDDKYKMVMTLRTLGHNPAYLEGKPLRLNVNLEQNLLAAFQSMMLTYDLPNKLKERFEKAGAE